MSDSNPTGADRSSRARRRTLLIVSQVYVPDPASVGQHMADVAVEMARRGWRVVVLTSARGYDDPSVRYPARETRDGVEIVRLPLSSFGKRSIPVRLLGAAMFLGQTLVRGLLTRRLDHVLVSTSPPMAASAVVVLHTLRRVPFTFWSMDVNPDQAVALGRVRERSLVARVFDLCNRWVLRRARRVVALDRFMAARLERKTDLIGRLSVIPPWPHEDALVSRDPEPDPGESNPFRVAHGLVGKRVLMYSGNHSPSHPLTTFLDAARRLEDRDDIVFVFVGGGLGKRDVDDAIASGARNVRSLPYQPLSELMRSLSAADVHLVSFGDAMVGVVHPCKAYGAMAVGRPLLLAGPKDCPIADLIERYQLGWRVDHGEGDALASLIEDVVDGAADLAARGERGREAIARDLSQPALCGRLCDLLEA